MNHKYQKHNNLTKPDLGDWNRNELAILGTTCDDIKHLAYQIIQSLPSCKIGYADADHKSTNDDGESVSAVSNEAYLEYTNKISFTQINLNTQPNAFQKRVLFNDCDLVLINGNHFTAKGQIIVIDERKPLEKKLDKLTNVKLILVKKFKSEMPDYISQHLPGFSAIPVLSFEDGESITRWFKNFIQQTTPPINGLVLAGGRSTRMGTDKGSLQYHEAIQREHVYRLLQPLCNEVFLSLNDQQANETITLPFIQDTFLKLGPAGGILSAFQQNPNSAWLIIACDLPFLNNAILEHLIQHRNPSKMATAFLDAENKFPEPLITIWEPKAYPVLLQFLAQGYDCPRKVLINSDIELLQAPDASLFTNVNTKEEYEKAVKILNAKHDYC